MSIVLERHICVEQSCAWNLYRLFQSSCLMRAYVQLSISHTRSIDTSYERDEFNTSKKSAEIEFQIAHCILLSTQQNIYETGACKMASTILQYRFQPHVNLSTMFSVLFSMHFRILEAHTLGGSWRYRYRRVHTFV